MSNMDEKGTPRLHHYWQYLEYGPVAEAVKNAYPFHMMLRGNCTRDVKQRHYTAYYQMAHHQEIGQVLNDLLDRTMLKMILAACVLVTVTVLLLYLYYSWIVLQYTL